MKLHLNMFASLMWMGFLARFIVKTLSTMSVTVSPSSLHNSFNRFFNHIAWYAHNEVTMYSVLQEESASTISFFEHREIGAFFNINMYTCVDFLSSLSPHQLESIYHSKLHYLPFSIVGNWIPQPTKPLTYRIILLIAAKWDTFDISMNLLTILTLNAKFDHVLHK